MTTAACYLTQFGCVQPEIQDVVLSDVQKLERGEVLSKIPMEEFLRAKGHVVHFTSKVFLVEISTGVRAVLKESDLRDVVAERLRHIALHNFWEGLSYHQRCSMQKREL